MATLDRPRPLAVSLAASSWGWLRSPSFDLLFIAGVAAAGILASGLVLLEPSLFPVVLVADMWLLGFHHVVSTFTRLAFDTESFHAHRFLVVWLPLIVLGGATALFAFVGGWTLPTLYLYWQWFHYTRQSYGIAQIYRRKAGALATDPPLLAKAVIYLLPLWGILQRSWEHPQTFLDMEIKTLPVPLPVVQAAAVCALVAIAVWVGRQVIAWRAGRLPVAYTLYMLSHLAVFAIGYLGVRDISYGWLAINVWHNGQYILLVWMYNNNRFKDGIDPEHRFLSTISQRGRMAYYFLICLGISTFFYMILRGITDIFGISLLALSVVAYQTINFHHYIVDGIIWKVRKPRIQAHLGLSG